MDFIADRVFMIPKYGSVRDKSGFGEGETRKCIGREDNNVMEQADRTMETITATCRILHIL